MTLPTSGPLSLNQINNEFGRGRNLGAYRGTTWYTDAGASGTFTNTDLGFNQFYGKRVDAPYRYGSLYVTSTYSGGSFYLFIYVFYGQPFAAFEVYLTSTTSGLPLGLALSGNLDSNGDFSNSYLISPSDGYWFPASQTNCFTLYQDGTQLNTSCTSS